LPYKLSDKQAIIHGYRVSAILDIAKELKKSFPSQEPSVIDLGCGRGETLRGLKGLGYRTYGLDIDPKCVTLSSEYGKVVEGDMSDIDSIFAGTQFDLVITSHTLEHVMNPLSALKSMRNVMKRLAIVAVPNVFYSFNLLRQGILGRRTPTNPGHLYEWDRANFENLLVSHAGLRIVSWHTDWVRMVPFSRLRKITNVFGLLEKVEQRLAPRLFPHLSESLIVLCEKRDGGHSVV
jgi:SAM-dependent methyltransferase